MLLRCWCDWAALLYALGSKAIGSLVSDCGRANRSELKCAVKNNDWPEAAWGVCMATSRMVTFPDDIVL